MLEKLRARRAELESEAEVVGGWIAMIERSLPTSNGNGRSLEAGPLVRYSTKDAVVAVLGERQGLAMTNKEIREAMIDAGWLTNAKDVNSVVNKAIRNLVSLGRVERVKYGHYALSAQLSASFAG